MKDERLILFQVGQHFFALPITVVREVVSLKKLEWGDKEETQAKFRDEVIHFVDVCETLQLETSFATGYKDAIILKSHQKAIGIKVTHVLDVIKGTDFGSHHSLIHLSQLQRKLIDSIIEVHRVRVVAMKIKEEEFFETLNLVIQREEPSMAVSTEDLGIDRKLALRFDILDQNWCVEIQFIDRILPNLPLSSFPGMPSAVLGIRQVQGEVMPVLSAEGLLGLPQPDRFARLLTLRRNGEVIGLAVQRVREIVDLSQLTSEVVSDGVSYTSSIFFEGESDRMRSLDVDLLFEKGFAS